MRHLAKKIVSLITGSPSKPGARLTRRDLIGMESKIGAALFGPIARGHRREFFCLDRNTWIWYEEWTDSKTRKKMDATVRYEIHENGILKVQEGQPYQFVEGQELHNLVWAMHLYYERAAREIYHRDPHTGRKLAAQAA